jgi:Uma2 family endonuclease
MAIAEQSVSRQALSGERMVLRDVSWALYCQLRELRSNWHIRMTYDRGTLEMMSPSRLHERLGYITGRLIDVWTEEFDIDMQGCRTMTFRREDLDRGLEPDNCYYIAHEPQVRTKQELDFTIDPPPDLAVEIELSSGSIDKLELYAAFRVPEVWRYDGESLTAHHLGADGQYAPASASRAFPDLPLDKIVEVLQQVPTVRETTLIREFHDWVRSLKQRP